MYSFLDIMSTIMTYGVIFGIPSAILIFFIISLVIFLRTPKSESVKRKTRLCMLTVSASITAIMIFCVASFMIIMMFAVSHM